MPADATADLTCILDEEVGAAHPIAHALLRAWKTGGRIRVELGNAHTGLADDGELEGHLTLVRGVQTAGELRLALVYRDDDRSPSRLLRAWDIVRITWTRKDADGGRELYRHPGYRLTDGVRGALGDLVTADLRPDAVAA